MKIKVTDDMVAVGMATLRRMMRDDTLILDFKADTLRMIVRQIFIDMMGRIK
jgi:hypothetical protein